MATVKKADKPQKTMIGDRRIADIKRKLEAD